MMAQEAVLGKHIQLTMLKCSTNNTVSIIKSSWTHSHLLVVVPLLNKVWRYQKCIQ